MKRDASTAIQLINVGKKYEIHHEKPTFVETVGKKNETFWALKHVNLTLRKGEKVGIIGPNGAGKTTLLKIMAGITSPTEGTVHISGKVVSLIGLDAGLNPELSGIENIFLNGMLLGVSKQEIQQKLKSIIRFADIHRFIDVPLYTYSSGMRMRLGFSVAVHTEPDILILDEGMSVGDERFRRKSYEKIQQLIRGGVTLVLVSHIMEHIRQDVQRIVLIEKGKITHDGNKTIISSYQIKFSK